LDLSAKNKIVAQTTVSS